ncbi:MAG TPA: hypothetical protein VHM00_00890 [Caldimonas sp.]|jgi:hypothetical protein|nr:hypothetical protein [Caldimonas sp.]HEX2539617.1 hypothetical protein [Caldimonas sp.]
MNDAHAAAQADPSAPEREAGERLSRVHGAAELHAAILALLLPFGSKRAMRAWRIEASAAPDAEALRRHASRLSPATRLPWLERLLGRAARQPLAMRQQLLQATRRVMGARGVARPIDRLHWLLMRRALGDSVTIVARAESSVEVAEWLESDVFAVSTYSAFLSRVMAADGGDEAQARAWYDAAMVAWQPFADVPTWTPTPAEAMVEALGRLQTLSWMQRPVVIRNWVVSTLKHGGIAFHEGAADALRMTCALLDSPEPPELARHYAALPAEAKAVA